MKHGTINLTRNNQTIAVLLAISPASVTSIALEKARLIDAPSYGFPIPVASAVRSVIHSEQNSVRRNTYVELLNYYKFLVISTKRD